MPLLEVDDVRMHFRRGRGPVIRAVDGVSFSIEEGETLSLIGESGSGKSTVARVVLGLLRPTSGRVVFAGQDLGELGERRMRALRSTVTAVFQEPYESLNPRMTVKAIVGEPLAIFERELNRAERLRRIVSTLEEVGLNESMLHRRPADLSGGQQQRVGIARALVVNPRLIVLDEPTSALDLTVRATILNLLRDLQERRGLTYLFISHDIATVRYFSTRTAVMYLGKFMEFGPTERIIDDPQHPYSIALLSSTLSAVPGERSDVKRLGGEMPSPSTVFSGCPLSGRCDREVPRCSSEPVPLAPNSPEHLVACIRPGRIAGAALFEKERAR